MTLLHRQGCYISISAIHVHGLSSNLVTLPPASSTLQFNQCIFCPYSTCRQFNSQKSRPWHHLAVILLWLRRRGSFNYFSPGVKPSATWMFGFHGVGGFFSREVVMFAGTQSMLTVVYFEEIRLPAFSLIGNYIYIEALICCTINVGGSYRFQPCIHRWRKGYGQLPSSGNCWKPFYLETVLNPLQKKGNW